jgi:hypothetical protein
MPVTATGTAPAEPYRRLWAELTNKCQLEFFWINAGECTAWRMPQL